MFILEWMTTVKLVIMRESLTSSDHGSIMSEVFSCLLLWYPYLSFSSHEGILAFMLIFYCCSDGRLVSEDVVS
jgi:hypothetical protein